jgi:hypothetical protein
MVFIATPDINLPKEIEDSKNIQYLRNSVQIARFQNQISKDPKQNAEGQAILLSFSKYKEKDLINFSKMEEKEFKEKFHQDIILSLDDIRLKYSDMGIIPELKESYNHLLN